MPVLTDADVDGAHIQSLLLTFFFRYQPELISRGLVYIACPPLYRVTHGRQKVWCFDEAELSKHLQTSPGKRRTVQHFKGLGEMQPTELWETTLNKATRSLRRVGIEDAAAAERACQTLMGSRPEARRAFIAKSEHSPEFLAL